MWTLSKDDVTFEVVETFCHTYGEGVHVEYKRELPRDISKTIASFANTYGGLCLVGVTADKANNRVTSIDGIPKKDGYEERIQQSALMNIYPAVIPEVIIVELPATENVVLVIRVPDSLHAPHAVNKGTKVYFRVASVSQPYQLELADIDRIEYMLKRRDNAEHTAQRVLSQIAKFGGVRNDVIDISLWGKDTLQTKVIIRPIFIYRPLMTPQEIYDTFCDSTIRQVSGGVAWRGGDSDHYTVINEYGIVYDDSLQQIEDLKLRYQDVCERLIPPLKEAARLYEVCEYLGSIQIKVEIQNVYNTTLILPDRIDSAHQSEFKSCLEKEVFLQTQCLTTELIDMDKCIKIIQELSRQLLWAFDVRINASRFRDLRSRIQQWYSQL